MRLIDADALLEHQVEADKMGAMLVVGKGFIMDAPTITPQPDPETGLVPWREEARKQFVEVVNENVGKRAQGCWYCNDDVMQVVDSPNKPPINATYCGMCGRKLEVEG